MPETISPDKMKQLENSYMKCSGVPGILLMEQAARAVCDALRQYSPSGKVLFIAGCGNNGGDAYAASRIWQSMSGKSVVWEISCAACGDSAVNRFLALESGIPILTLDNSVPDMPQVDAIVDGLFGTGFHGKLTGIAEKLASNINRSRIPVISIDIPSGLDGSTGNVEGECIHAARTVTFHRMKDGLLMKRGPDFAGKITVSPILIPENYGNFDGMDYLTYADISEFVPHRAVTSHKGTFGRCVIFAGSPGMAGAAAFCASACVTSGAGLVTVLCRESLLHTVQCLCPEAMCAVLPEENGSLTIEPARIAEKYLAEADSACVGCGIGTGDDSLPVLRKFAECACPVVWDADGLNMIALHPDLLHTVRSKQNNFFTPHPGEAARLLRCSVKNIADNPRESLALLHESLGGTVLLKGARTLMTDGERVCINIYGTPALGKGGSGDVLTGILGTITCRSDLSLTCLNKMQLAVMLHSLAGVRCAKVHGENCLTPKQLVESISFDVSDIIGEIT